MENSDGRLWEFSNWFIAALDLDHKAICVYFHRHVHKDALLSFIICPQLSYMQQMTSLLVCLERTIAELCSKARKKVTRLIKLLATHVRPWCRCFAPIIHLNCLSSLIDNLCWDIFFYWLKLIVQHRLYSKDISIKVL